MFPNCKDVCPALGEVTWRVTWRDARDAPMLSQHINRLTAQ